MTEVKVRSEQFLLWEKHWLKEWDSLDIQDRKVLAALYWFDLKKEQKECFSDHEYIELAKIQEQKKKDLVNDPVKMKAHFLMEASPLLDKIIQSALGTRKLDSQDAFATAEVWGLLKEIISSATNPAPLLDLKGKDVSDQIDEILSQVSLGQINFEDAKNYMSLVSSGYNLQTLPELLLKLESLED